MINAAHIADRLGTRFGLDVVSEIDGAASDSRFSLRVGGIHPPNGFRVGVSLGWRSAVAVFTPDTFAAGLIKTLCMDEKQRRLEFSALCGAFAAAGNKCVVRIDERTADTGKLPEGTWTRFELTCSRLSDKVDGQRDAEEVGGACLALLLSLLPSDESGVETLLGEGLPEGALSRVAVNRYERSPVNRAAAIAVHGAICKACGFDFWKFYGELGEGFIEVHHRIPVSQMGEGYVVEPAKDLVPLCANCHRMVHRQDPPISAENLRERLSQRGVMSF